ncbi:uncharacterized protein LACBIDRAFT_315498 [Laccaria bicolor S238N-H82]|uniref:Predicted protein n=1 Tax=Laccaria bicolor (strain S238N-H82 / ATCC MYA-4686) TaxID=486041 RepID=B0D2J1_LACBS|nr:uncharacterized protein LACBIDRAFT_315498 [Laccaria bicolor S238N-H82]EDR10759.1 predicted protein [Laccaria bicolor S238N-H82]|eukprot:XP_001878060.1 predicted protein [Laccaria bicolor S238N-H82]
MLQVVMFKYVVVWYPGLGEKRPCVLATKFSSKSAPEGHWYQGRVHVVRQAEVGFRFHESFG